MNHLIDNFWAMAVNDILPLLQTDGSGLTQAEAQKRLAAHGPNAIQGKTQSSIWGLLLSQFKSPIILILLFAIGLSFFLHEVTDGLIILTIVLISGLLGFWQEFAANNAVADLLAMVKIKADVLRDQRETAVDVETIVPGDVVMVKAGDVIPGDCLILESNSLFVDEATLTGETYPAEKISGAVPAETPLAQRKNTLWMGTHVISGSAKAVIVATGKDSEFGKISDRLKIRAAETEFEIGVRRFGYLLMEVTLTLVLAIFAINVFLHRPVLDSFLFSLALAVGLTPQLLPAIISINLAHGAKLMAAEKVIVKRLAAIENFGSMDVLCSDKTGTLTDGVVRLQSAFSISGQANDQVLLYAYLNASLETGFLNPIDQAIRSFKPFDISAYQKLGEKPYDFIRKRLSILVSAPAGSGRAESNLMVTKGALPNVLAVCSKAQNDGGEIVDIASVQTQIQNQFQAFSSQGFRTLGVAYKPTNARSLTDGDQETEMVFLGFVTLFDPLKPHILETVNSLKQLGISLKIITGDNRLIAANIVQQMGITGAQIVSGSELRQMGDRALLQRASEISVFAEVEPNQKERIIVALRKAGHVVGYMGDGINDVSALHDADVSISVDSAVDVAKEAADIVLLEKDLDVLIKGVKAGRMTFANTLKYVFMATSANFGNMFSMAGASLFLPFLPLLPKQILLTNLLTDFPEMAIATDAVDAELVRQPRRWNITFIRKFMFTFGLISSIFDYLTFFILRYFFHASAPIFRTGWFLESVISASLIVLVIRSRQPFFKSRPGKYLAIATVFIVIVTLLLPYTPLAGLLGFQPLPLTMILAILLIVAIYIVTAEIAKQSFYKRVKD